MKYFWALFTFEPWLVVCGWDKSKAELKTAWDYHGDYNNDDWRVDVPAFIVSEGKKPRYFPHSLSKLSIKTIKQTDFFYRSTPLTNIDYTFIDAIEHHTDHSLFLTPEEAMAAGRKYLYKRSMKKRKSKVRKEHRENRDYDKSHRSI